MGKRIDFSVKDAMVSLTGACFWYWNSFYSFLDNCGVPQSIYNRFPKDNKYNVMRNVLSHLEDSGNEEVISNLISNFYKMKRAADRDALDENKAKNLLEEFRELVGNDPIEKEIQRQKQEQLKSKYINSVDERRLKTKKLEELNSKFNTLTIGNGITPQERGYALESLFCDLLQLNEIEYSPPYKSGQEQIDGHFKYEKFDYLIETKWKKGVIKHPDLSTFDGKIKGKAQSTRGLFLAANDFDENAVNKFSGDSPRIILMTGEDLAMILNGLVLFHDAMAAKVDAIVKHGNINFPIKTICK